MISRAYEEPAGQSIHCLAPIVSAFAALLSAAIVVHARNLAAELLTVPGWNTLVTYWLRLLGAGRAVVRGLAGVHGGRRL